MALFACSGSPSPGGTPPDDGGGAFDATTDTGHPSSDGGAAGDSGSTVDAREATAPGDAGPTDAHGDAHDASVDAHVMLGAYTDQSDNQPKAFPDLEKAIGRSLAIENQREVWDTDFAQADELADIDAGVIPMISWTLERPHGACATLQDVSGGTYDAQIETEAKTIAGLGVTVFIRFYKEFTDSQIDKCAYGMDHPAGNPTVNGPLFVAAWTHVVDLFRANGATNVQWIWGPSAGLFTAPDGGADATTWTYFYPGDSYVDWIANDNYNKSTKVLDYANDENIANWYAQVSTKGKPLMQSETGAGYEADASPDPQTAWVQGAYKALPTKYPAIRAWVYWDATGQQDYRLQGPGLAAFKTMAGDPYFQATH